MLRTLLLRTLAEGVLQALHASTDNPRGVIAMKVKCECKKEHDTESDDPKERRIANGIIITTALFLAMGISMLAVVYLIGNSGLYISSGTVDICITEIMHHDGHSYVITSTRIDTDYELADGITMEVGKCYNAAYVETSKELKIIQTR